MLGPKEALLRYETEYLTMVKYTVLLTLLASPGQPPLAQSLILTVSSKVPNPVNILNSVLY